MLFSVYSFCNATFLHSGYVIEPRNQAPLFTELRLYRAPIWVDA